MPTDAQSHAPGRGADYCGSQASRAAFLARVREAARAGAAYRVRTNPKAATAGYVGVEGDLCEALAREIDLVGGIAHVVPDDAAAAALLRELLAQYAVKSSVCWRHPLLDRVGVRAALAERQAGYWDYDLLAPLPREEARLRQLEADLCISSCDFAIAETGSLVVRSRPGQERLASLIAPVYIAFVERAQIVPDLLDVFAALIGDGTELPKLPSNLAIITGPSKTGDIELQLTTGVHGPGKWHVIVIQ